MTKSEKAKVKNRSGNGIWKGKMFHQFLRLNTVRKSTPSFHLSLLFFHKNYQVVKIFIYRNTKSINVSNHAKKLH